MLGILLTYSPDLKPGLANFISFIFNGGRENRILQLFNPPLDLPRAIRVNAYMRIMIDNYVDNMQVNKLPCLFQHSLKLYHLS